MINTGPKFENMRGKLCVCVCVWCDVCVWCMCVGVRAVYVCVCVGVRGVCVWFMCVCVYVLDVIYSILCLERLIISHRHKQ